jgi:hypothetical protein
MAVHGAHSAIAIHRKIARRGIADARYPLAAPIAVFRRRQPQ